MERQSPENEDVVVKQKPIPRTMVACGCVAFDPVWPGFQDDNHDFMAQVRNEKQEIDNKESTIVE